MSEGDSDGLFRSLRHRPFAFLWSGQAISRVGDSVYTVALAWWVLEQTGSAARMGTVLLATVAPVVVFGLVGGVFVDRLPRLRVMFMADIVRAGVALLMAIFAASGRLELWEVYTAGALFGLAQAFFQPAYVAAVPEIARAESLQSANAISTLSAQLAQVVGPALGAAFIVVGGAELGFAVNGVSFLVSALTLLAVNWKSVRAGGEVSRSMVSEAIEGLSAVGAQPWLWFTIGLASLANVTLAGPMRVTLPYLLREERDAPAAAYGALLSFGALGAVVMAIWLGRRKQILRPRGPIAYCAWIVNGLMLLCFAIPAPIPLFWVAALLGGSALVLFELIWINTLQEMVPRHLLGRVAGIDYVGSFGLLPVGLLVAGVATDAFGARGVLVVCGILTAALPAMGLLHPRIRRLR